ncbi:hypothetical protein [Bacillus sp. SD075]|nr:hypothetical protein [Bacillus sp. SD075]
MDQGHFMAFHHGKMIGLRDFHIREFMTKIIDLIGAELPRL